MNTQPAITSAAALIADPARAAMLLMLVHGCGRPAGELAYDEACRHGPRVSIWPSFWLAVC